MRIRSVQAFPLAYPEPHYKGIERYLTLVFTVILVVIVLGFVIFKYLW